MNGRNWPENAIDNLGTAVPNKFPPLAKEGQGGFAGCFRAGVGCAQIPLNPPFSKGEVRRSAEIEILGNCEAFQPPLFSPCAGLARHRPRPQQGGEPPVF